MILKLRGRHSSRRSKKAITQTIVAKKREEVRDDLREEGDRARDRPGGYAEAPNYHLDGDSDDDQKDRISESESNCSEQWYELDGQEQEALISLRGARKKLQHATKSRRFYPKCGGRARSTGKSIDELKKVTPCNRRGAIVHWEEACTQPNHIHVNLADFAGMEEPDYDVWTSKRGRDSEETGTESDMTEGTEETITDPEEVPAKRSRR